VIAAVLAGLIVLDVLRRQLMRGKWPTGKVRHLWPYALAWSQDFRRCIGWPRCVLDRDDAGAAGFIFVGGLTLAREYFAL